MGAIGYMGFPRIRGALLGVPIIRIMGCWGLHLDTPVLGLGLLWGLYWAYIGVILGLY